jgi:Domain of unknown function (DUF222)
MFESLVVIGPDLDGGDEVALIERITELETLKAAAAAGQARLTAAFVAARKAREAAAGMPRQRRGRGVASEIALARHDSPQRGNRHLGFATALVHEMPHTLAALETGVLNEWRATLLVRESACLDVEDRRRLDAELCADPVGLVGLGDHRLRAEAKAIAYRLDPHAVVERAAAAEKDRCVTIRPAPESMTYLTGLLPMVQGVAVYAALKRAADVCGDGRSRGQVMADTLVERVTGRAAAVATPIAVGLVLSDETLTGGNSPALVDGYGPIPAGLARALIEAALDDPESQATLRRLYVTPTGGALVAMESRSRFFPKGLARFIGFRDQRCRTPYCDAPVRHIDHITPHALSHATRASDGQGLCEACNYAKQAPGWRTEAGIDIDGRHTTQITTPTGAHHHSQAPPQPRPMPVTAISAVEARLRLAIARNAA